MYGVSRKETIRTATAARAVNLNIRDDIRILIDRAAQAAPNPALRKTIMTPAGFCTVLPR
jgi:hypothetical protein